MNGFGARAAQSALFSQSVFYLSRRGICVIYFWHLLSRCSRIVS